jgi:hypothetical protein
MPALHLAGGMSRTEIRLEMLRCLRAISGRAAVSAQDCERAQALAERIETLLQSTTAR